MENYTTYIKLDITLFPPLDLSNKKKTKTTIYFDASQLVVIEDECKNLRSTITNESCNVSFYFSRCDDLDLSLARLNNYFSGNTEDIRFLSDNKLLRSDFKRFTEPLIKLAKKYNADVVSSEIEEY